jgi:hypothetical protein
MIRQGYIWLTYRNRYQVTQKAAQNKHSFGIPVKWILLHDGREQEAVIPFYGMAMLIKSVVFPG